MEQTTSEDTVWLQRMQNLAFEMSGYYERTFPIQDHKTILEYYKKRLNNSIKPSDNYHNREIIMNYPTLRNFLGILKGQNLEYSLSDGMKQAYDLTKCEFPNIPKGILADLNACAIYLIASCERTSKIVR